MGKDVVLEAETLCSAVVHCDNGGDDDNDDVAETAGFAWQHGEDAAAEVDSPWGLGPEQLHASGFLKTIEQPCWAVFAEREKQMTHGKEHFAGMVTAWWSDPSELLLWAVAVVVGRDV